MIHHLKMEKEPFKVAWAGEKPWELRFNDRNFEIHDEVILEELGDTVEERTGREIHGFITFVLKGGKFGLPETHCIFTYRESMRLD